MDDIRSNEEKLKSLVYRITSSSLGSESYWKSVRNTLFEVNRQKGRATCFYTLSFADYHHPVLLQQLNTPLEAPSKIRSQHVMNAPGLADALFDQMARKFLELFLKTFGMINWSFNRLEYQDRGTVHCHGVSRIQELDISTDLTAFVQSELLKKGLIVKDMNDIEKLIFDGDEAKQRLIKRINELLSAQIIDTDDANATSFAQQQLKQFKEESRGKDILTHCFGNPDLSFKEKVARLQLRVMLHKCVSGYCRENSQLCRFGFPSRLEERTDLEVIQDKEGKYHVQIIFK